VNKLTVYEDGAIEAECGPLPCGSTGACSDDLSSCKAASDIFSGMKWARNGQRQIINLNFEIKRKVCKKVADNFCGYLNICNLNLASYFDAVPYRQAIKYILEQIW